MRFAAAAARHRHAFAVECRESRGRNPPHARTRARVEHRGGDPLHAADAEFGAIGGQMQTAQRGRVKKDVANRRAELLVGQIEVLPRFANEDAGGLNRRRERLLAVDQQHLRAAFGEPLRRAQARQSRADDRDVVAHEVLYSTKHATPPVRGSRFAVRSSRFVVRGSWLVARGWWLMVVSLVVGWFVGGSWVVVGGSLLVVSWLVARGSWLVARG